MLIYFYINKITQLAFIQDLCTTYRYCATTGTGTVLTTLDKIFEKSWTQTQFLKQRKTVEQQ